LLEGEHARLLVQRAYTDITQGDLLSSSNAHSDTRDRLIDATVDLLRTKGPAATGTNEILAVANAPRGSFYYHFPDGKDQLIAEAVARGAAATASAIGSALARDDLTLPDKIEFLIAGIAEEQIRDDYSLGCAVGATVLEAAATTLTLRDATAVAFATWTDALTKLFEEEGLPADLSVALADGIVAAMEGATMLARSRRDASVIHHVAYTAKLMVSAARTSAS
jgi:TetR/AcrR family transcriptional repressor of lmrAB and yxaGH operons